MFSPCRTANSLVSFDIAATEISGRDYISLARQAAQAWEGTSAVDMVEVPDKPRDVLVGGAAYGEAANYNARTVGPCENGIYGIDFTYIRLNLTRTANMPSSRVLYIFEHEFGHLLGLDHPGSSQTCTVNPAVMFISEYGYLSCGLRGLRADDVRGVNARF